MTTHALPACAALVLAVRLPAADLPWPAPVAGHQAPAPGEHPRLLFRKSDLPDLRKRAETPEGRALVSRLRTVLGGGDKMPAVKNDMTTAYGKDFITPRPNAPWMYLKWVLRTIPRDGEPDVLKLGAYPHNVHARTKT